MNRKLFAILASAVLCIFLLATGCGGGSNGNGSEDVFNSRLSVVTQWNELALAGVRSGAAKPTITTRQMFIFSVALYDAWALFDDVAVPYVLDPTLRRPSDERSMENKQRAVSQAAYHVLTALFPSYSDATGNFAENMRRLNYEIVDAVDMTTPEGVGLFASQQVLESRSADGSNQANGFVDITSSRFPQLYAPVNSADPNSSRAPGGADFDLNHWQPLRVATGALVDDNGIPAIDSDDPSTYADQTFLTPHWGNLTPFSLTSANQFRPQSPPQAGSSRPYTDGKGVTMTNDEAWNAQFDEVLQISADLTDRQKVIAEFWADGPRTESPPGHWNQLAHGVSERDGHSVDEDIKMFFALNASLFDVAIATWEAKRNYDFIRPASAIRHKYFDQTINAWAGPNLGTQPILGQEWRPYQNVTFVTPPFPEFVSGHSTFSSSAAQVLTLFTGSNVFYDGVTQTSQDVNFDGKLDMLGEYIAYAGSATFENTPAEDVVLQWPTFQDAAYEAGISRLYGGIHIQDGNLFGRAMGEAIGQQAFALAQSYWDGSIAR